MSTIENVKVLIIEDDEAARKMLGRVIEKEGFKAILAKNGKEGLEIFKKESPGIVITDLKMPEIDGMEVLHTVKRISPDTEVIVVTGFGDYDTVIQALREGAIDYLKKPIDLDQLIVSLGRCIEKITKTRKMIIKPTILLLEDEDITREKLVRVLSKEGWDVLSASDGEEGMKIFYETKIDVIIADIKMPKKDGLEVLHEVKKQTEDCEIIIVSGFGDDSSAIQAMRDGAINYLKKPIDLEQMIVIIEKTLGKLNMRRSILYKEREIQLSKEIIMKITGEMEIIIDARDHKKKPARDFAQKILDMISVSLFVVNKDMKVLYANEHFKRLLEFEPEVLDQKVVNRFLEIGLDVSLDSLCKVIIKVFKSESVKVETISLSKYSYISMMKVLVIGDKMKHDAILIVLRGERK